MALDREVLQFSIKFCIAFNANNKSVAGLILLQSQPGIAFYFDLFFIYDGRGIRLIM